jgi:hypothetical protein
VNLAVCDFIMMAKTPIFIYNSFNRGYALGHWGCQIFGVMGTVRGNMKQLFLSFLDISLVTESFHPLKFLLNLFSFPFSLRSASFTTTMHSSQALVRASQMVSEKFYVSS